MPKRGYIRARTSPVEQDVTDPGSTAAAMEVLATPRTPSELLAQFSDSIALLSVAHASLASKEIAGTGEEEVALRHVLARLRAVYSGYDLTMARTAGGVR